jgi:hypothetical protein
LENDGLEKHLSDYYDSTEHKGRDIETWNYFLELQDGDGKYDNTIVMGRFNG